MLNKYRKNTEKIHLLDNRIENNSGHNMSEQFDLSYILKEQDSTLSLRHLTCSL